MSREKRKLEADRIALRAQLLLQFNAILQTRDTARGLIVNMSDVLFDTAKFSLRPEAREKLAKVAGIVSGHPGLKLEVEGHTDSVGADDYNQTLSEQRGGSVRDYPVGRQGMAGGSVTSNGFGKTRPVASNDTASGRQQNRRVELVISGDLIKPRSVYRPQPANKKGAGGHKRNFRLPDFASKFRRTAFRDLQARCPPVSLAVPLFLIPLAASE